MRGLVVGLVVLVLAGCASRGSLPPGHHGGSFADGLGSALVWLVVASLIGAGMSAAAALFVRSTVAGFAGIMWAVCLGCCFTLAGAVALGAVAPALPWILGGSAVVGGSVYGLHHWRGLVAWWQGARGAPSQAPVVASPLPVPAAT